MGFYLSFLFVLFVVYIYQSLKKNLLIRPVIIYGLILYIYPLISNMVYYFDLIWLYPWHPLYSENDYLKAIEISLCSLIPITTLPFIIRKQDKSIQIIGSLGSFVIIKYL